MGGAYDRAPRQSSRHLRPALVEISTCAIFHDKQSPRTLNPLPHPSLRLAPGTHSHETTPKNDGDMIKKTDLHSRKRQGLHWAGCVCVWAGKPHATQPDLLDGWLPPTGIIEVRDSVRLAGRNGCKEREVENSNFQRILFSPLL